MEMAKIKKECEEIRISRRRLDKIAETACEQLKSSDIPYDGPVNYCGFVELIKIEGGTLVINGKKDDKFKYFFTYAPKHGKRIEVIMKDLGIEKYVYKPKNNESL